MVGVAGDYFATPKRSGEQFPRVQKLDGPQLPIVANAMNFRQGGDGEEGLSSTPMCGRGLMNSDALPGMLSDVTYPLIFSNPCRREFRGISLAALRAFEGAARNPAPFRAALQNRRAHARAAAQQARRRARSINQDWPTVKYTASALVDLKPHLDPSPTDVDVVAFERQELARIGVPKVWGSIEAVHPLGRAAIPEGVAEVVAFLASPAASFMTGRGSTLRRWPDGASRRLAEEGMIGAIIANESWRSRGQSSALGEEACAHDRVCLQSSDPGPALSSVDQADPGDPGLRRSGRHAQLASGGPDGRCAYAKPS
jgi:hypothetical protein